MMHQMAIKLLGLGLLGYTKDVFNSLDAIIVIVSWVEIGVSLSIGVCVW